jgi:hypothetical protein
MLDFVADGLAIGHLRRTDVRLDLELPLEAVDEDVEVKFAHALHDGLTAFEVGLHAEGRVFGGQTLQTLGHLLLVVLRLGLDRDLDHRVGEGHRFQNDRLLLVAERVTRGGFLQTGKRDDVAREGLFDLFAVVGVHHHHATDALLLALGRVQDLSPFFSTPE